MGSRIAARLLAAGIEVNGYDTNPAHADERNIPLAPTIAEVTRQSDIILLSLPDSTVIESVIRGSDGISGASRPGQIVVDLSTAAPRSTAQLAQELMNYGVEMLDAGVSGGAAAAEEGTLTIMVGGSPNALARARPVLEVFSSKIFHMGAIGSGHTTKLLNNFLNGVSLAATAEVMIAARRAGLDLHQVLDVVNSSSGVNFATLKRFPRIVDGDYMEGGLTGRLMMKDLVLYSDLLTDLGAPSLNGSGALASFGLMIALGYGDAISNRVVDAIGDIAGGIRLHPPSGAA